MGSAGTAGGSGGSSNNHSYMGHNHVPFPSYPMHQQHQQQQHGSHSGEEGDAVGDAAFSSAVEAAAAAAAAALADSMEIETPVGVVLLLRGKRTRNARFSAICTITVKACKHRLQAWLSAFSQQCQHAILRFNCVLLFEDLGS